MSRSRDDNAEVDVDSFEKHPALKNFSRTMFKAQYTAKTVLKYGAIGLVAGIGLAAGAGIMGMIAAGGTTVGILALLTQVPLIGPVIKSAAAGLGGAALQGGLYAAGAGGILGAVTGLVMGVSNADAAADAEEDKLVAKYEQQQARRDRMRALEERRDQQRYAMEMQAAGMKSPNMQIPFGRPRQQGPGPAYGA